MLAPKLLLLRCCLTVAVAFSLLGKVRLTLKMRYSFSPAATNVTLDMHLSQSDFNLLISSLQSVDQFRLFITCALSRCPVGSMHEQVFKPSLAYSSALPVTGV